jgi:pimeloyl-ACP methyl ester carboxylesterase
VDGLAHLIFPSALTSIIASVVNSASAARHAVPGHSIYTDILAAVRERLSVRGHSLEMQSWGEGHPPVVLLHEGLGSVARWRSFPAALATTIGRRVIAYSRAGHGDSDAPRRPRTSRFMHEEATEWLPELLATLAVDDAVLFGHSDGGSIALVFAATYPARVHALVLEAPHVFVEDVAIASIERIKKDFETTNLRERLAKYHGNVAAAFHGWNDVWLAPEFRSWNLEAYLPQVTCPVLLIQGEDDQYGTLSQIESIARGVGGDVDLVVMPHCGHAPHRQQPGWTLSTIQRFLARVPRYRSTAG